MLQLDPNEEINAEHMFSLLMKRRNMGGRFRLPYTPKQVYVMLIEACKVEVIRRHREFVATEEYKKHLWDISKWLTSKESTFGLFLCGGAGNGKTTVVKALQNLYRVLTSNEGTREGAYPRPGYIILSAKELVMLAKAYNNPTRENVEDVYRYKSARTIEILAIDDLGSEPKESMSYGDFVTAAMDIICFRYDEQFCTLVTSNLAAGEISTYYDERIADRFREMMHIVDFGTEESFRKK